MRLPGSCELQCLSLEGESHIVGGLHAVENTMVASLLDCWLEWLGCFTKLR